MRTYLDCVPCFVRQAVDASRMVTNDPAVHERVLRGTLELASQMRFDRPPPWMGQQIHRLLREATGVDDPYREVKERSNALGLELYPALKRRIAASADPFDQAKWVAGDSGLPLIEGCLARFECDRHAEYDGGDHAIIVARVLRASVRSGAPLLFFGGQFGNFATRA